ncbi:MAG: DUF3750 domain-containing protein [Hyphomicrobiaceae bacterium]
MALAFILVFLLPLGLHAAWWLWRDPAPAWNRADWSSAHLLPPPAQHAGAMVRIYAARVGRWRGVFAKHCWIVVKGRGADAYTRYDKVAWGQPVRTNGWAADGRWYGHMPELVGSVDGAAAEALIPKIRAAVASYPYNQPGRYSAWPGPNSNSFVAYVLARIPEAAIALPPTAIGKDWPVAGDFIGLTPSRTGIRVSAGGLLGVSIGWVEGIEVNVLGLVAGLDIRHPALKLPGFGRIGLPAFAPPASN